MEKHMDFESLNSLAEYVNYEEPFTDRQIVAIKHIGKCEECYNKFCCLATIVSATCESGYMVFPNILIKNAATCEGV
jgi:hypothetical protein